MNRNNFASSKSSSREWICKDLVIGGTYRLKPSCPQTKYGNWAKIITLTEFQPKYFFGIQPKVIIGDIGVTEEDYFPRVVGLDEQGKIHTIALSRGRARLSENGEIQTIDSGQMEYYEPI